MRYAVTTIDGYILSEWPTYNLARISADILVTDVNAGLLCVMLRNATPPTEGTYIVAPVLID